jgi:hypothetical protein
LRWAFALGQLRFSGRRDAVLYDRQDTRRYFADRASLRMLVARLAGIVYCSLPTFWLRKFVFHEEN